MVRARPRPRSSAALFGLRCQTAHQAILQTYVWQDYDLAPDFPELEGFLRFWERELEGPLHSVAVSHQTLIRPCEFKAVDGIVTLH